MNKSIVSFKNITIYFFGLVFIAFGVTFALRADFGMSSWDTFHFSLHKLLGITIGTAMIVLSSLFTLTITLFHKNAKYLVMFVPVIVVGLLVDLINLVILADFDVISTLPRIITFLGALTFLPFGGSLLIVSTFPAGVYDEFMFMIMKQLKSNKMILIRVIIELAIVSFALLTGFAAGIGFGQINIGTIIFSIAVGLFIKIYLKGFSKIGYYQFNNNESH